MSNKIDIQETEGLTTSRFQEDQPTSSKKLPQRGKFKGNKRLQRKPRFNEGRSSLRHDGAAYEKKELPMSLRIPARQRHFPVYTANLAIPMLAKIAFYVMQCKDFRLTQNITQDQFEYVLNVAWLNRIVQIAIELGIDVPDSASYLKSVAKGIMLPDYCCQYIETLGAVISASGVSIVPKPARQFSDFFPDPIGLVLDDNRYYQLPIEEQSDQAAPRIEDLPRSDLIRHFTKWYFDPRISLIMAGRPIPTNDWRLDVDWVMKWNAASTRGGMRGIAFRVVELASPTGKESMLVSTVPTQYENLLQSACPQSVSGASAESGIAYNFRTYEDVAEWPGLNQALLFDAFTGREHDPTVIINDGVVTSFSGRPDVAE